VHEKYELPRTRYYIIQVLQYIFFPYRQRTIIVFSMYRNCKNYEISNSIPYYVRCFFRTHLQGTRSNRRKNHVMKKKTIDFDSASLNIYNYKIVIIFESTSVASRTSSKSVKTMNTTIENEKGEKIVFTHPPREYDVFGNMMFLVS